jgi:polyhydroxyalkanoate synthase
MATSANDPADLAAAARRLAELQQDYLKQMSAGWSPPAGAAAGTPAAAAGRPEDKRFAGEAWSADPRFDAIKSAYQTFSRFLQSSVDAAPLDERARGQLRFAMRQYADALSPANFFATNPEAIQLAAESGGKTLADGMNLFFQDLAKGRISMTDESAFEVGRELALTPGAVVFENELVQLLQYAPATPEVHERPLVIIPPCINKYYILDLQPANSFVRYAVEQGFTVFLVSWRNVAAELGHLTWDDYLELGVMQAIDVAREITGAARVNTLGFCVGGTLLASALGVMKTRGEDNVASMTMLTAMLEFGDAGEIGLLVSEEAVAAREAAIGKGGVLQGSELAFVFSSLRANDLVWPYVVNSYLKGKGPPAFDLLHWNSDATNLPGPMFCWYVRNTYLENRLREPGGTVQCGVPVNLSEVDVPAYLYASRDDHIVPWRTAYASNAVLGGECTFVLGASGHIAGVINPAAKGKRNYWRAGGAPAAAADEWLAAAEMVPGSWWPHWSEWLARYGGPRVPAPTDLGSKAFPPIEPAPGRYVKEKAR